MAVWLGLGRINDRTGAEHLGLSGQLGVYFQADDSFKFHKCTYEANIRPIGADIRLAKDQPWRRMKRSMRRSASSSFSYEVAYEQRT